LQSLNEEGDETIDTLEAMAEAAEEHGQSGGRGIGRLLRLAAATSRVQLGALAHVIGEAAVPRAARPQASGVAPYEAPAAAPRPPMDPPPPWVVREQARRREAQEREAAT
jgi:hypothetical protein